MINTLVYETGARYRQSFMDSLEDMCALVLASNGKEFQKALTTQSFDVIILDLSVERKNPFNLLQQIASEHPYTPVVAVSNSTKTDFIVQAVKEGAFDFIHKPFSRDKIRHVIQQALETRSLRDERDYLRRNQDVIYKFDDIIAESPAMKAVMENLRKFSNTDSLILMTGETGTGKSFLSGTIHFNSPRRNKPFIIINCANISETLLESELFGHEKGAFTDADKQRIGRFEQARGGTVFLDEIGEMSLSLQAKLLRVLEDRCFERVGGSKTIYTDVRFIAATNRHLEACMKEGHFRQDLYYRLKVLSVQLPPLRERRACIEPLSAYLLEKISRNVKKHITGFSPSVLRWIKSYSWPGNMRELSNSIERAVILEETAKIQEKNFPFPEGGNGCVLPADDSERDTILEALEESLWIQKDAAKLLGISPRKLNYQIKKFGIRHRRWRKNS